VRLPASQKMNIINLLTVQGVEVKDFDVEVAQPWK